MGGKILLFQIFFRGFIDNDPPSNVNVGPTQASRYQGNAL
jgi:hypothetical protein